MHADFAHQHKEWENRIEVRYLSLLALKTFKVQSSPIASIGPGEPFHIREVGKHWLMNWYVVREKGVTLHVNHEATFRETESFVNQLVDTITHN